jgi:hypothetical protein
MVILNGQDRKSDEFRPRAAMTFASLSWRSERQLSILAEPGIRSLHRMQETHDNSSLVCPSDCLRFPRHSFRAITRKTALAVGISHR